VSLASVTQDHVLFNKCNVCNEPDFTEQSTKVPIIEGFKYVYANPDDNYMRLLGVMGEDDANRIMEMCNAGAINTAAGDLGIETGSVADIFQKVLDTKYEKYMYDQEILEIIDKFRSKISALDPHPEGKKHTNGDLDSYRNAILKKNIPNVTFYSVELSHLADDMKADWTAAKEKDGAAISRVMDNIKEGMCQICCLPLEGIDTLIVRCCGLIVCDICSIKGNQLSVRWSHKLKATTLLGSCANCKADIDPRKDLIYLNQDFDIESILNARGDEVPDVPEPVVEEKIVPDEEKKVDPMDEIKNPKLKALLQICRGEIPDDRKSFEVNIPHLLQGRTNKPLDKDTPPKVLVFANYNETLNTIEEFLVEWKVPFLRLAGSSTQIAETVKKFHTYGTVLLINSQQHCAGLDLQHCSTDLVYYHKILDQNLESQVCGRIQRLGRKVNARIHYLLYKNEQVKM
jgi:SNF2 family DNA or RNA helicase